MPPIRKTRERISEAITSVADVVSLRRGTSAGTNPVCVLQVGLFIIPMTGIRILSGNEWMVCVVDLEQQQWWRQLIRKLKPSWILITR